MTTLTLTNEIESTFGIGMNLTSRWKVDLYTSLFPGIQYREELFSISFNNLFFLKICVYRQKGSECQVFKN